MKELQFKTDIKCGGCVAKITPSLNGNTAIKEWKVDTSNPNKVLTVETEALNEEDIKAIVQKAGFQAEKLRQYKPGNRSLPKTWQGINSIRS